MNSATDKTGNEPGLRQELTRLQQRIPELERQARELEDARRLQAALFEISELTHTAEDMDRFYAALHRIVGGLMYAENLFIAVRTPDGTFRFEYFCDSVDTALTPAELNQLDQEKLNASLTAHVMREGELVHLDREGTLRLCEEANIRHIGSLSVDWLAVPLKARHQSIGVLVVQSYDERIVYTADDEQLLEFVCQHIATGLERRWTEHALKQAKEELEDRVGKRTRELEQEIQQRRRGEKLQRVLYEIARLAGEPVDLDTFYRSIHEAISDLIYARNIFIAIEDESREVLRFVYHVDEKEPEFPDRPIPEDPMNAGPTMLIYASGQPLLYNQATDEPPTGYRGALSCAWLGVPLVTESRVIGALAVQSYDPDIYYDEHDKDLLSFVAQHVATAIERRQAKAALERAHDELEQRVQERTRELRETNSELRAALEKLETTQAQLVEADKMASLGALVAGVAHEINTPLGVAVTAASHLQKRCRKLLADLDLHPDRTIDADTLASLSSEPIELVLSNLNKAARLVSSFKQVAADQNTEDRRVFNLATYLEEILTSLRPKIRRAGHTIELAGADDVEIDSYPFALYPIISNLVMNSLLYAWDDGVAGTMTLTIEPAGDRVRLIYCDDGRGMSSEVRERIFEPFFTTRRGRGGTGLGMHIVYNHVLKLGGGIRCESAPGEGAQFLIDLPRSAATVELHPVGLRSS